MSRRPGRHRAKRPKTTRGVAARLARLLTVLTAAAAIFGISLPLGVTAWAKLLHDGSHIVAVTSNSMQPAISAGDILAVKPAKPHELRVGQVATIKRPSGTLVTHRIININNVGDQVLLTTKGDANTSPDPDIASSAQVLGVMQAKLPGLAQTLTWVQSSPGRLILLTPFFLVLIGYEVVALWRPKPAPDTPDTPDTAAQPDPPADTGPPR